MREISLTQGYVALVDDADFERVNGACRWTMDVGNCTVYATGYPYGWKNGGEPMHRFIMDAPDGRQVDHRDGDGLNNRRENLRLATNGQNQHNRRKVNGHTSQYKGVHWDNVNSKWRSQIRITNGRLSLGRFDSEAEAARAYDTASRANHGEFAAVNFPRENERSCREEKERWHVCK